MLALALDTSTRHCSMAIVRGREILAKTAGVTDEPYASRVFNDLQAILRDARLKLADIELFAVASGPGSFTGLRVGLTAIKGWAEVLGRPIVAVSGLEAVASQSQNGNLLVSVIDARGGQLFGGMYKKLTDSEEVELVGEEVVLPVPEFGDWVHIRAHGQRAHVVTPTLVTVKTALGSSENQFGDWEEVSAELAPTIGLLGQARARNGQVVDAASLEANYLRRPDAEVKWKGG